MKNGSLVGISIETRAIRFKTDPVRFVFALALFWGAGVFFISGGIYWLNTLSALNQ
ncbi:hypothetical protein [Aurantivibrio plasticivorans]